MASVTATAVSQILLTTEADCSLTVAGNVNSLIKFLTVANAEAAVTLTSQQQQFSTGALVTLYEIDATSLGGSVYRFTPMTQNNQVVVWRGVEYPPLACESEGWEINGTGQLPQPKLRVSNVGGLMGSIVIALQDLVGAQVTRYRTFAQFLDNGSSADPTVFFEPDIFVIQRKATQTKALIEWELSSILDQENVFLPNRFVLKYNCTQRYRIWDPALNGGAGGFDYTNVTCPYNGTQNGNQSYDENGNPVPQDQDVCGRLDSDCALRFPGQPLPTWAFPGVGAVGS
jgi:lambda family phage minor tail protein L